MNRITPQILFLCSSLTVAAAADDTALFAKDMKQCQDHLRTIYEAIQSYRKDHKALPPYLSSLLPKYLDTEATLLCPLAQREKLPMTHPELADPKTKCSYVYQFSALPMGNVLRGTTMTMEEGKRLQMALVGGAIPIVSCYHHGKGIHIGFDGALSEAEGNWERLHEDKIVRSELESPKRILARLMRSLGDIKNDVLAMEKLMAATEEVGVVATGKDLTEQQKRSNAKVAEAALQGVKRAEQFLANFPQTKLSGDARRIQLDLAFTAALAGDAAGIKLFSDLSQKLRNSGAMTDDEASHVQLLTFLLEVPEYDTEAYLRGAQKLRRNFPKKEDPQYILLSLVDRLNPEERKALLQEILAAPASDFVRDMAEGIQNRTMRLGQPVDIAFKALDGAEVDIAKLRGKVVLLHFWAVWDSPSLGEIPKLKAAYDTLHSQGFEIVGVCLDYDRSALSSFVQEHEIPWPQLSDDLGWDNHLAKKCRIGGLPTLWLIGKDGKLADLNARENLLEKAKKLLAAEQ